MQLNKTWLNNNLQIKASPLSQTVIEFKTNITKYFDNKNNNFITGSTFKLIINFRECQSGEYYNKD